MDTFNEMDFAAKRDILRNQAVCVATTVYFQYVVKLYAWHRFFIEQYYDTEEKAISRITLANDKDIEKHLCTIGLADLAGQTP